MPAQFENGRKFDDKNSLQDLMSKNSTCTLRIDLSRSKSVEKCSVFIFVECLNDAVSNLCRSRFRFQNLPAKNVPFSCEQEPIRHIFHRFQNLPASYERSLRSNFTGQHSTSGASIHLSTRLPNGLNFN